MTTAHRPTWSAAKGGEEQGGMRFYAPSQTRSVKDMAGYTKMKYRKDGQSNVEEMMKKDLKAELEEKEGKHFSKLTREEFTAERENDMKFLEALQEGRHTHKLEPNALDADEEDEDVSSSESDESDEDDEAELLAELERIRQERAEEASRTAAQRMQEEEMKVREEVCAGNPLLEKKLSSKADFTIKRKWDDDVVFKNQSSKEPVQQRRFINDTIRNDFHRRFLDRYMK